MQYLGFRHSRKQCLVNMARMTKVVELMLSLVQHMEKILVLMQYFTNESGLRQQGGKPSVDLGLPYLTTILMDLALTI